MMQLGQDQKRVKVLNESFPTQVPPPNVADSLIAQQLSTLSIEAREQVYHGIHGISDAVVETPELINESLAQMAIELNEIPDKGAYDMAYATDPNYVSDPEFRLRFLRADRFDPEKAALRLARHFQTKLDLFGPNVLARDILQDDLDLEDMEALYSGLVQRVRVRDRAGRLLIISCGHPKYGSIKVTPKMRAYFYLATTYTKGDVETEKNGATAVIYQVGQTHYRSSSPNNPKGSGEMTKSFWSAPKLMQSLPLRLEALHICYDSPVWRPMITMMQISFDMATRLRLRAHFGSHQECKYSLMTFGIPADMIPVCKNGAIDCDSHVQNLKLVRTTERLAHGGGEIHMKLDNQGRKQAGTLLPGQHDVLFGRGKGSTQHIGNIKFRTMLEDRIDEYNHASKEEKTKMNIDLLQTVRGFGGRFLKDTEENGWVEESDDKEIRKKIANAFRTMRRNMNLQNNNNNSSGNIIASTVLSNHTHRMDVDMDAPRKKPRVQNQQNFIFGQAPVFSSCFPGT